MNLLKKETGIDVKSASSSIEEIVARQFVERQAKKRQISLPPGNIFADTPVAKKPAGKGGKAPEPPKPAAAVLRPRLVKTIKPAGEPDAAHDGHEGADADHAHAHEPVHAHDAEVAHHAHHGHHAAGAVAEPEPITDVEP